MARGGRPHTKLYQEERERPVIVMVDFSPSMFFATRGAFKSVVAARAAALIGWATIRGGDRIGAFFFGGGRHHEIRPAGGRRGVLRLIRDLSAWTEPHDRTGAAGLGDALRRLRRVARPGSLVFILSDFYSLDDDTEGHLTRLRRHNDLVACQIIDPLELAPPPPGRYGVTDGHATRVLDTRSNALRKAYRDYFAAHDQRVSKLLRERAAPLLRLVTRDDVAETLRRGLAQPATAERGGEKA
jgi:uncharacterized protein (DUF58 family)